MVSQDNVALYMRVSVDDANDDESNSIKNQRALLMEYSSKLPDFKQSNVMQFCDDGYSGTNFERPEIMRLLEGIKKGDITCVVVKDFSRFGRNYIEVSDYIEQIFPFWGVRFISVNDNFDSKYNSSIGLDVSFKNLIHDYYSKDMSEKIRTALKTKMKNGSYISAFAFYGYKVSDVGKRTLVVDEESAKVVKRIFELKALDYTTFQIARLLNDEGEYTPSKYKKVYHNTGNYYKTENFWRAETVRNIITDERYMGKLIAGKTVREEIGKNFYKTLPKDQWIVRENTHEAIVDKELYEKALRSLKYPPKNTEPYKQRVLYNKVRCNGCGYVMERNKSRNPYFWCETNRYISSPNCVSGHVSEKMIEDVLLTAIHAQFKVFTVNKETSELLKKNLQSSNINCLKKINQLQSSVQNLKNNKLKSYKDYSDGRISKDDFQRAKAKIDSSINELEKNILEHERIIGKDDYDSKADNPLFIFFENNQPITELTREIIDEVVEKIVVYDENRIEIVWSFKDMIGN